MSFVRDNSSNYKSHIKAVVSLKLSEDGLLLASACKLGLCSILVYRCCVMHYCILIMCIQFCMHDIVILL